MKSRQVSRACVNETSLGRPQTSRQTSQPLTCLIDDILDGASSYGMRICIYLAAGRRWTAKESQRCCECACAFCLGHRSWKEGVEQWELVPSWRSAGCLIVPSQARRGTERRLPRSKRARSMRVTVPAAESRYEDVRDGSASKDGFVQGGCDTGHPATALAQLFSVIAIAVTCFVLLSNRRLTLRQGKFTRNQIH